MAKIETSTDTQSPRDVPMDEGPVLSLVVPMFNEDEMLAIFFDRVVGILETLDLTWEIVAVDDGSRDQTLAMLLARHNDDNRIRIVKLSRNFGKDIALSAGLDHARGQAVVPIDADLQDPPELITQFVEKWRSGVDVVYGRRVSRLSDSRGKRTSASLFYRLHNLLSDVELPENTGDFRLMDRRVVDVICQLPERNRFMKGLFAWVGFSQEAIDYERPIRTAGTTKWSYWRLWNFALDGITSFSTVPLRVWSYLGIALSLISAIFGMIIIARTLIQGVDVPGYASLMVVVLFLGGIQLISLGVFGEYLGRIYMETKQRPLYVVAKVYE